MYIDLVFYIKPYHMKRDAHKSQKT